MRPSFVHSLCLVAGVLAAGCAERRFAGPPPPSDSASPDGTSVLGATPEAAPPPPGTPAASWIEAVRLERWGEAAALIDALPEATRARADMRYVRARAAVGVGDGARAAALLEGLQAKLPDLAADIERWRAEAGLLSGPYAPAAAYFARSTRAHDLTRAATAYEKAGDTAAARATAERAVGAAARAHSTHEEAAARMARAAIAEAHGGEAAAVADYEWVTTQSPDSVEGRGAAAALERIKHPPASHDEVAALDAGAEPPAVVPEVAPAPPVARPAAPPPRPVTAARRAPAAARPVPGAAHPPLRGEALHTRGMELFRARDYLEAARTLREAAAARSGHEAEDLHHAARALSRADHDEEAVKVHREVTRAYPRSPFAERSAYHAARLELTHGHFKEAAQGYAQYLATYRRGEHREDAEYERALALVSSGGAAAAQKTFEAMARKATFDRAGRLRELAGVAALRAGDRPGAIALFTEVARSQPLTWAGMAARARLGSIGVAPPPLMDPPLSSSTSFAPLDLRLPATPALLASVGLDGDAESHLAASERELGASYAGRESEALCGLYGLLSRGKRRYRLGQNVVDTASLMRAPGARERWAWECVYPAPFSSGVSALEVENALPHGLIHAVMRQESAFDPAVVSPASAVGLMQLMPATARQAASEMALGLDDDDLTRPDVNLKLGAFYIAKLLRMFQGHVPLAAAAYNAGPRAASHWVEVGADNEADLWVARIPFDETRTYVARVAQNLARYQWLAGGDDAVSPVVLEIPAGARAPADAY